MRNIAARATCWSATFVLALAAGCGSVSGEPGTEFGFNEDLRPRAIQLQAEIGMPVTRFKVPWGEVEPRPGEWEFTTFDALYELMLDDGLRPLILAVGAPCWAGAPGAPCAGVPSPAFDGAWSEYVRRLVARYPDAIGLEVWNEPNSARMFPPRPDPARYTQLLAAAHRAVKEVDPELPVISGGLVPTAGSRLATGDAQFLSGMYAAGAAGSMDAIGAHPYPIAGAPGGASRYDLDAMKGDLERLRAVRDAAGRSSTPIWITEMGVSTRSGAVFPPGLTGDEQAEALVAMVRATAAEPDVPVALVHRLIDTSSTAGSGARARLESGFGVFRADGEPKPAACALSDELGGSLSC
jgi:hypothetical protein